MLQHPNRARRLAHDGSDLLRVEAGDHPQQHDLGLVAWEAGNQREELEYLSWIPLVVWGGPRPVDEGIARCESVLEKAAV